MALTLGLTEAQMKDMEQNPQAYAPPPAPVVAPAPVPFIAPPVVASVTPPVTPPAPKMPEYTEVRLEDLVATPAKYSHQKVKVVAPVYGYAGGLEPKNGYNQTWGYSIVLGRSDSRLIIEINRHYDSHEYTKERFITYLRSFEAMLEAAILDAAPVEAEGRFSNTEQKSIPSIDFERVTIHKHKFDFDTFRITKTE